MTVRERERPGTLADFSTYFQLILKYRIPMQVKDAVVSYRNNIYYNCPRCQKLLDWEFLDYCSNCRQSLDWNNYQKVKRTYLISK